LPKVFAFFRWEFGPLDPGLIRSMCRRKRLAAPGAPLPSNVSDPDR
jgi:hypothetical protein